MPSTLCLLINLVKISLIFSSKPEIALGIFFGLCSFKVLTKDFFNNFFESFFLVFLIVLDLETLLDLGDDFFLVDFFLVDDFFFRWIIFFLSYFFFLFYHNFILQFFIVMKIKSDIF